MLSQLWSRTIGALTIVLLDFARLIYANHGVITV